MSSLKKATVFSQIQPLINRTQDKSGRRRVTAKGCFKNNTTQIFPDMENVLGAVVLFRMVTGTVPVVSGWARGSTVENNSQKNALRMKGITDNGPGGLIPGLL